MRAIYWPSMICAIVLAVALLLVEEVAGGASHIFLPEYRVVYEVYCRARDAAVCFDSHAAMYIPVVGCLCQCGWCCLQTYCAQAPKMQHLFKHVSTF